MEDQGQKKKIFIIAGEASGDVLGGALMRSLRAMHGDNIEYRGVGGPFMMQEGLDSLVPMEELCVMGISEVIEHLPRLRRLIGWMANQIEDFDPDIVVTIDLPDFNFRVSKLVKRRGYRAKLLHYVAPTVWAWREGRAKKISQFLDGLMCLFPFEPPYFKPHGLNAEFVGHPIVDRDWVKDEEKQNVINRFKKRRDIPDNAKLLGVMFGSRPSEFNNHAPTFAKTLQILREEEPDLQLIVPTLPHLQFEVMELLSHLRIPAYIITDEKEKWDALACVDGALAVSGTMALELAYADVPHVIAYKTSWFNWALLRLLVHVDYAHLANIILNKRLVPEYLQGDCDPETLAAGLLRLMNVPQLVAQQRAGFKVLRSQLRGKDTSPGAKAAQFVSSFFAKNKALKTALYKFLFMF